MNKIISFAMMIICVMIISSSYAQGVCRLEGNHCVGDCGPWYWGVDRQSNEPPKEVNAKVKCHKVNINEDKGKPEPACHCFMIVTTTRCRDQACDDDGCPNVYATPGDAMSGLNPIKGVCISPGTGNAKNCACRYEYPKE